VPPHTAPRLLTPHGFTLAAAHRPPNETRSFTIRPMKIWRPLTKSTVGVVKGGSVGAFKLPETVAWR